MKTAFLDIYGLNLRYRTEFNNPFGLSFIRYTYLSRVVSLIIKLFLSAQTRVKQLHAIFVTVSLISAQSP